MNEEDAWKEIKDVLKSSFFAYICTVNEGNPHITPVFFIYDEGLNLIYFMSSLKSRKMKNILANNKVSLTVDFRDPINPFNNRGVMIEGEAKLEAEIKLRDYPSNRVFLKESALKILEMFEEKYPILKQKLAGKEFKLVKKFSEVLVSIKPKKMVYWGGGPKFKRIKF
jgi:uncharacterized pyridoxamine 5'-phosphate oxidase family protein